VAIFGSDPLAGSGLYRGVNDACNAEA